MLNLATTLRDGALLALAASVFILLTMRLNPRIWLNDYPNSIRALVPAKTESERRLSLIVGIPFLILLAGVPFASTLGIKAQVPGISLVALVAHAFGVAFVFNLVDWLILDWLVFCTLTPSFVVIPGTEGAEGYRDYRFHIRGFLIGTAVSAIAGVILGTLGWIL